MCFHIFSLYCKSSSCPGLNLDRVNFLPRSCYNRLCDRFLQSLVSDICPVYFDTSGRSLQYQQRKISVLKLDSSSQMQMSALGDAEQVPPKNACFYIFTSKGALSDVNIWMEITMFSQMNSRILGAQMNPQTSQVCSAAFTRLYLCPLALVLFGFYSKPTDFCFYPCDNDTVS